MSGCIGTLCCAGGPSGCNVVGVNASLWIVGFPVLYYDPSSSPYEYPITRRFLKKTMTISATNTQASNPAQPYFGITTLTYSGEIDIDAHTGVITITESGNICGSSGYEDFLSLLDDVDTGGPTPTNPFGPGSSASLGLTSCTCSQTIANNFGDPQLKNMTFTATVTLSNEYTDTDMAADLATLLGTPSSGTILTDGGLGYDNCVAAHGVNCDSKSCALYVFWPNAAFALSATYGDELYGSDPRGFFYQIYPWNSANGTGALQNPFATFTGGSSPVISYEGDGMTAFPADPSGYAPLQQFAAVFAWDAYLFTLATPSVVVPAALVSLSQAKVLTAGTYCQESATDTFTADASFPSSSIVCIDATGSASQTAASNALTMGEVFSAPTFPDLHTTPWTWENMSLNFCASCSVSGSSCV